MTQEQERQSLQFCGGALFFDHASGKIFVCHQVSLSASDTIHSKRLVEHEALECGITVKKCHANDGVFKAHEFKEALEDDHQIITKSGVGAHHQNGVAERAIGAIQSMAHVMLLHLQLHWPNKFDASSWLLALDYAAHIHNHLLCDIRNGLSPQEVFCGVVVGCEPLH